MTGPGALETAIDFARSSLEWKLERPDSVGRFALDASLTLFPEGGRETFYLGAQVFAGNIYGTGDLFRQPAYEFAAAFSSTHYRIFRSAHGGSETDSFGAIAERFVSSAFDVRTAPCRRLELAAPALREARPIVARARVDLAGLMLELEFPVRHLNIDASRGLFQAETGPLLALAAGRLGDGRAVAGALRRAYAIFNGSKRIELLLDDPLPAGKRWSRRLQCDCEIELLRLE